MKPFVAKVIVKIPKCIFFDILDVHNNIIEEIYLIISEEVLGQIPQLKAQNDPHITVDQLIWVVESLTDLFRVRFY